MRKSTLWPWRRDKARGATLYVTLEPCCHHGKTPPCTDALIRAGIERVVAAMLDPFPQVAGKGVELLRAAGITVETGLCEPEARSLNAPYLKLLATGKPYVHAKWAMSLDGKIATRSGDSRWISNEASRKRVHELRRPNGRHHRRHRHRPGRRSAPHRSPARPTHRLPSHSRQLRTFAIVVAARRDALALCRRWSLPQRPASRTCPGAEDRLAVEVLTLPAAAELTSPLARQSTVC